MEMEDKTESKTPFWSSVPGILTAVGGIIVAVTGLISVLVTTGVMGPKANTNTNSAPPTNTSASLASAPPASPSANAETDRYTALTGKWEIIEEPSQDFDNVKNVTWNYDATVWGNVLTLTGRISAIDGDKNLSKDEEKIRSTLVVTLIGLSGIGEYKSKKADGSTVIIPATVQLEEDLTKLEGRIQIKGQQAYMLDGRKL